MRSYIIDIQKCQSVWYDNSTWNLPGKKVASGSYVANTSCISVQLAQSFIQIIAKKKKPIMRTKDIGN